MARFVYSMQSVLNVKYSLEDQAKATFATRARQLEDERAKLQAIYDKIAFYEEEIRRKSLDVLNVRELQSYKDGIENKKEEAKKQIVQVNVATKNLEIARNKLTEAIKERKIHEKLKERQFEEFKEELAKAESSEIDEVVNYKYTSRQVGETDG
ncbi:MAG: flagellar export protein FliJ [Lachnospiraceae bacterium]|nr:flagellar export protein FliJ [Lachnospiraceae bacterium]MCR5082473.1 flagellar export protein FliJ [Parasporobacterium sp.]